MTVFRLVFWLSVLATVIPANPADIAAGKPGANEISAMQVIVSDFANICQSKPEICHRFASWFWPLGMRTFVALGKDQPDGMDFTRSTPLY
jgi:hypothetical protein